MVVPGYDLYTFCNKKILKIKYILWQLCNKEGREGQYVEW